MKSLVSIIFKFQLTNAHVQYQLFQTEIKYLQNLKIKQTISEVITSSKNHPG